jgi:hypothetical protein
MDRPSAGAALNVRHSSLHHLLVLPLIVMFAACGDDTTRDERDPGDTMMPDGSGKGDLPGDMDADMGGADMASGEDMGADAGVDMPVDARPVLRVCDGGQLPSGLATESWRHTTSRLVTTGDPGHSAQDIISPPAEAVELEGKFAYGTISKDLEDERAELWIDDCASGATRLGSALTDSDGRARVELGAGMVPEPGTYKVWWRVAGDGSTTQSWLRVMPRGTKLMVFDIDATLTTDDLALFQDIFTDLFKPILQGDYIPEARAAAAALTLLRRVQGYQIIYLTGRPYTLTDRSREWLLDQGAAPGTLHLTDSVSEIAPSNGVVGDYKAAYIARLQGLGYTFEAAYGNATTDIYAYGKQSIPPKRTYIAGKHGGEAGTVAVGEGWAEHVVEAEREAAAVQPFTE